ncbi:MAG: DUF1684 domain-containing protein [Cyclobacteriaceae bacterium]|nr:DUF1684 domain-containing protein [Cyclobacteriaceae bacterium]
MLKPTSITVFYLALFASLFMSNAGAQTLLENHIEEIKTFQKELNEEFADKDRSPLPKNERKKFKSHNFYPVNESFIVEAQMVKVENRTSFQMKTSTDRLSNYFKYADLYFEINGVKYSLSLYQSERLMQTEQYKNYLFLPFTDLTNGEETYGGGRYIDLFIPEEGADTIVIDFNKAYSPSCAYSHDYSCPIPPAENHLDLKVKAGVKNL